MQPVVLTVLRSGGEYTTAHVDRLREQLKQHAPKVPLICLSDVPTVVPRYALTMGWPGWWSKIELFKVTGPVLYMDLDTSIVGPIDDLLDAVTRHEFIALRDFNAPSREMGSGLMGWSGDMRRIYDEFAIDPAGHMARCRTSRHWGDQGFIEPLTPTRAYWQTLLPGQVVSWKKHCRGGIPAGARVVCFHGKPRPWDVGQ